MSIAEEAGLHRLLRRIGAQTCIGPALGHGRIAGALCARDDKLRLALGSGLYGCCDPFSTASISSSGIPEARALFVQRSSSLRCAATRNVSPSLRLDSIDKASDSR